jgi:hypothetical protein
LLPIGLHDEIVSGSALKIFHGHCFYNSFKLSLIPTSSMWPAYPKTIPSGGRHTKIGLPITKNYDLGQVGGSWQWQLAVAVGSWQLQLAVAVAVAVGSSSWQDAGCLFCVQGSRFKVQSSRMKVQG